VFRPSGEVLGRSDYLPFGETLNQSGSLPRQRFTGQERDGEAGLDYFNARSLQARTGRMNGPDPLFGNVIRTPQSWNRYSYVRNQPLTLVDPTGMQFTSGVTEWAQLEPLAPLKLRTTDADGGEFGAMSGGDRADPADPGQLTVGGGGSDEPPARIPPPPPGPDDTTPGPQDQPPRDSPTGDRRNVPTPGRTCFERWSLGATAFGQGSPGESIVDATSVVSQALVAGDLLATLAKGGRGLLGTKKFWGSGMTWTVRHVAPQASKATLIGVADVAGWIYAPVGVFTSFYDLTISGQCAVGVLK
jgi:RHS repeat-associated protein